MRSAKLKFEKRRSRIRHKISKTSNRVRLSIFKSGRHIYAQIIDDSKSITIAAASTLDEKRKKSHCNIEHAIKVGEEIAKKAYAAGIKDVVFDRGGYKYHGVVKALADAAREKIKF
ncbi:50S ribosomal protein L18 [Rickettsia rickettsii]|uniref:Large ribosomal subunit protein uL18 n=2 Tax=Rickettsia rickettsii TaxID=783 RepID=RL18_RICRO|nr:50S ribosomal protein L18 [Rickettsia rickettsii]A8GT53.1 RecName: Full=Large ribosomal subunit protein uL18; AltName: Full=50S ribosomal protein L18 [Rickettsia rickettsii str. 'Sheila Smith']B0BUP4.1 RecName: Full=Large ribosomal subunit protein uL18; AltName: Full=50S ribosomal protein L18 [Rickettsia rickettsii str. Iowa]ABV76578.1 50S ribosomal protein L18 [Rickettsia rickettsii str. 'Sheila Smith']ABY72954.1 LSU ribosomal protein L18P [Rickettsia rickettsii str. Iowa]AFB21850.1 50S ri